MNAIYEHKNKLTFIGFHTGIAPDEGYKKCPEFWDKEYNEKFVRLWQTMKPETPVGAANLSTRFQRRNASKCAAGSAHRRA